MASMGERSNEETTGNATSSGDMGAGPGRGTSPDDDLRRGTLMPNASIMVGECLVGEGVEVAHVDVIIGSKDGPVGQAFANAWVSQKQGHTALLALLTLNLQPKPSTVIINKVTMQHGDQADLMFGPAAAAVAKAVADSVGEGIIPRQRAEDWCIVGGIFIHWEAKDKQKIYDWNYQAFKEAIRRAVSGEPSVDEVLEKKDSVSHPLA